MHSTDPAPALGILGLIGSSFRLLFANFGFLYPLAFLPLLALALLQAVVAPPERFVDPAASVLPEFTVGVLVLLVVNVIVGYAVTGVTCLAALDALLGKRHTAGEYLRQTLRHLGPIVLFGTLIGIAVALGLALLIVPGVYLAARYLPWTPAVVFENAGWSGLARAQDLTAGYRWPLAGGIVLFGLAIVAAVLLIAQLFGLAGGSMILTLLVEAAAAGLYYAIVAVFTALVYLRLREIKEGVTSAEVAASFD